MRGRILMAVVGLGCGEVAAPAQHQTTQQEIFGGELESGWPAIGALTLHAQGGYFGAICTGTLIDPRWVLTAAHCVDEVEDIGRIPAEWLRFMVGTDANGGGRPAEGREYRVARTYPHPQWTNAAFANHHDLALMELRDPVEGVEPLPLNELRLEGREDRDVFYAGFGVINGEEGFGGGVKRSTTLALHSVAPATYISRGQNSGVCFGDSGGPGLMRLQNEWRVVGVNSALVEPWWGDDMCTGLSVQVRVDAGLSWIRETMGQEQDCRELCPCAAGCQRAYCDPAECGALSCAESIQCMQGCDSAGCFAQCTMDLGAGVWPLVEAMVECLQAAPCGGFGDLLANPCVRDFCPEAVNACLDEPPPPPPPPPPPARLPCEDFYDCTIDCGGVFDAQCRRDCAIGAGPGREAFDTLGACLDANCADAGSLEEASACGVANCRRAWRLCVPSDGCNLTGNCEAGACRVTPWGSGTRCFPTRGNDPGSACSARPVEVGAVCDDGYICAAGRCTEVCLRDRHCSAGTCQAGVVENHKVCIEGAAPPPPPPPPPPPGPRPDGGVVGPDAAPIDQPEDTEFDIERSLARDTGCSTAPGGAWWMLVLVGLRRRRGGPLRPGGRA